MAQRAVLFANGKMPPAGAILPRLREDDYLIAVDGGLRHLRNFYRKPQLLIGDLDSLSAAEVESARNEGIEVRQFNVDKDETDLELALSAAAAMEFQEIMVVAALGGRLDQTLANLSLLMLPQLLGLNVIIENGDEEIFLIRDKRMLRGQPGNIVSLLPIHGEATGVETRGLKYPLKRETLHPEKSRGISNVMLEPTAEISLESGVLLCIHARTEKAEHEYDLEEK